ncbi:MAG: PIN domain-containing protein [Mogibacterium sp.]|nr:PIN domain-containing protein [Mogibacterium sp.]
MKALIDTCVILDYLQAREPFFDDALNLFISVANNEFGGYVTANSMTDLYYIIHRHTHSVIESKKYLADLTQLLSVIDTTSEDCLRALHMNNADYEDAVMMASARSFGMEHIITRNIADYHDSPVAAITPAAFLELLD